MESLEVWVLRVQDLGLGLRAYGRAAGALRGP